MVYELNCQGTLVAVTIAPTESPTAPWQAAASLREPGAPSALTAQGPDREAALRNVELAWTDAGYPKMDWDAIRTALAAVRAV
jgi:hypothetical protein